MDCPKSTEAAVHIHVDGVDQGAAAPILDMCEQAKSQESGEMDRVRAGKGILKTIVSQVPYVGYGSNLIRSEADVRCWANAPRTYHLFAANVPAGHHSIGIQVFDEKGKLQDCFGQTWHGVNVSATSDTVLLLRTARNKQNYFGLRSIELASAVRAE